MIARSHLKRGLEKLFEKRARIASGSSAESAVPARRLNARPYSQRQKVLISGATASVGTLAAALVAFGFRPIGLFSRTGVAVSGSGTVVLDTALVREFAAETGVSVPDNITVESLDRDEFIKRGKDGAPPIFIDDIVKSETDHFNDEVQFVRYAARLFENRIVHPAALAGLHLSRTKTYMFTGFPSSGNMIFQRCLGDVLDANTATAGSAAVRNRLEGLLGHYAVSHWHTFSDLIRSHFQDDGLYSVAGAPCGFGLGSIYMNVDPRESSEERFGDICVSGFPMWHHAWANPYHASHEPLTPGGAAAYKLRNVSCIQIVRHPLDVLVSIAGKLTIVSQSEEITAEEARNQAVVSMMNRDAWVHSMINALEKYYCAIAAARDQFECLRYEDLLSEPVSTIQNMGRMFGCDVTEASARDIWQRWSDKPAAGEGHRWDPRAEKWKEFVPARFCDRLMGSKLEAAAEAFGYHFSREDFGGPSRESDKVALNDRIIAVEEGRYSVLLGKEIVLSNDGFSYARNRETGLFAAGPAHVRASIDRLLNSSLVKDVAAASSCFAVPPELHMEFYIAQAKPVTDVLDQWQAMLAADMTVSR